MGVEARDERTRREKLNDYWVNEGPKLVMVILWVLITLALFAQAFYHYRFERLDVFPIFGYGLPMARAAAQSIKFNCAILLITVLRNFLSWLRGTFIGTYLPIDKNIVFHRYVALAVALLGFLHGASHYINYNVLAHQEISVLAPLGYDFRPSPELLAFTTLPGSTGHIISIIMILMYSSAIKYVRGPMFNVFWFTHHLFIIWYILLCIHGARAILEQPTFWMWCIGPMLFYAIERTLRIFRGNQDTILQLAVAHPSKVIELQMKKSTFKYKPGQYLFLNCPYIAQYEWHPFTITSAPEEDFVSLHIRVVGDWTGDLWNFLNPEKRLGVVQENLLNAPDGSAIFRIDGPYGAASEDVFDFKVLMLCAGGIGVTPFGSILKHIRFQIEESKNIKVEKVYFYWISRDKNAFEWFNEILGALEQENINNFLEIHTYLTGQLSVDEIKQVMHGLDQEADQITGLQSPTHFGRPNWKEIFGDVAAKHQGQQIGVFFCGPRVLSKELYKHCVANTSTATGTRFKYHKENF